MYHVIVNFKGDDRKEFDCSDYRVNEGFWHFWGTSLDGKDYESIHYNVEQVLAVIVTCGEES